MRDNEYTSHVLQAFRARFRQLNRNDAFPGEDASQMVSRVAASEDDVCEYLLLLLGSVALILTYTSFRGI